MRVHPRTGLLIAVLALFAVIHLATGLAATTKAVYSTPLGVYQEFMGGAVRLLFPLIVGVLAGWTLTSELRDRYVVYVRTRRTFVRHLLSRIAAGVALSAGYFFLLGLLTAVAAFVVAPAVRADVVAPGEYGLTAATALEQAAQQNPLGFALAAGPWVYGVAASIWLASNAAVFAVATIAVVLWVQKPILALLTPFFLYLGESIATQVVSEPQYAFLIAGPTPASLARFGLAQGVLPSVVLLAAAAVAIALAARAARTSGAYS